MSVCEVDKRGKLAIEINSQLPILRHEPDLFDEPADAFRSFRAGMLVVEGLARFMTF